MGERHSKWKEPVQGFQSSRRNLPHIELRGSFYFTTSTTFHRQKLSEADRDIVLESILRNDKKLYELEAAVVMLDHFHLLIQPLDSPKGGSYSLPDIFHKIKGYASYKIGRGIIWQSENYDHLVRNEKDFFEKLQYIRYNPVKSELSERPEAYQWLWPK